MNGLPPYSVTASLCAGNMADTTQHVVIHYNCIGAFDVPDRRKIPEADIIMETRKGVAVSYAPAV